MVLTQPCFLSNLKYDHSTITLARICKATRNKRSTSELAELTEYLKVHGFFFLYLSEIEWK